MPRAPYDPNYTGYGRDKMPDHHIHLMKQTIRLLERKYGVTRTEIAASAEVNKVMISRLFRPQMGRNGKPRSTSKCYAHKICRGLIEHCRRHRIDPSLIEDML